MIPFRDLAVLLVVLGSLPVTLARPWIGILVWCWLAYMNPHRLGWGFAYDFPFALLVAVATLVGFVFSGTRRPFVWRRETILLGLLWMWFAVTSTFAMYPEAAWHKFNAVSKILLMTFLVIPLFQDRRKLRVLLLVIACSIGFYGVKGGLFALSTGGEWMVLGPPDSFFMDNTETALALNMALPFFFFLAREEEHRWLRRLLWVMFGLTATAVPFTYSRGGILGLAVVLTVLLWSAKRRLLYLAIALASAGVFLVTSPERLTTRMESIAQYDTDESANLRFMSWRVAMLIAQDRPVVGGGFAVFVQRGTYDIYLPEYPKSFGHDAHSIYFNLLGEHGWVGLGLFVLLVGSVLVTLRGVRRLAKRSPELTWAANYAHMLQASIAAYVTTGAFLSVAYFDLAYQVLVLAAVVHRVAEVEAERGTPTPVSKALATPGAGRLRMRGR